GVVRQVVELVYEYEDLHLRLGTSAALPAPRVRRVGHVCRLNPMRPAADSSASQLLLQALGYFIWHEIVDPPAERGQLLHAARGQETVLRARHQVHGLYLGVLTPVELVHLQLVLEIRDRAQPLDDRLRPDAA